MYCSPRLSRFLNYSYVRHYTDIGFHSTRIPQRRYNNEIFRVFRQAPALPCAIYLR